MGTKRARRGKTTSPSSATSKVDTAVEQIKQLLKVDSACHLVGSYTDGTMVSPALVDLLIIVPKDEDISSYAASCAKALNGALSGDRVIVEGDVSIQIIFSRDKKPLKMSKAVCEQIKALPALTDAIKMVKLWCRQRLQSAPHGLSGFQISALLWWMHGQGLIDPLMSEMQMFRAFLNFFASGTYLKALTDSLVLEFEGVNVLGNVLRGNLQQLALDAKMTILALDHDQDQLSHLLTHPDLPISKFDVLFECQWGTQDAKEVISLLSRALGKRVRHLMHLSGHLGVVLDPAHCFNLLEMSTVDKKEFRALWGDRAQTRRFRDGSIRECAVWEELADERHLIVPSMIMHLLALHYPQVKCTHHAGLFDGILEKGSFTPTNEAFEDLSRTLKGLEMPLRVSQCVPIGDGLRFASVNPPNLLDGHPPVPRQLKVQHSVDLSFLIDFESSSRWPSDPHALQLTRQAFACRIAKLLEDEAGIRSSPRTDGCLEILHQGHLFVGHIHYEREADILKANASPSYPQHRWTHHVQPALWRQLHTLHTRNLLLGPAIRLAKRWTASQMLTINEAAIELLCAHLFLQPNAPSSLEAAFVRFLALIADPPSIIACSFEDEPVAKVEKMPTGIRIVTSIAQLPELEVEDAKEWQLQAKAALKALPRIMADHQLISLLFSRSTDRFDLCLKLKPFFKLNGSMTRFIQEASGDAVFQRTLPALDVMERLVTDLRLNYGKQATIHYDRYATDAFVICLRSKDASLLASIKEEYSDLLEE